MRKFAAAVAALLWFPGVCFGAFAIFQTYAGPPQITCNIVTGVASVGGPCTSGTTCNGSGNDAPAFWAFRTWALANQGSSNQVVLTVPNGSDCIFNSNAGNAGGRLNGVSNSFAAGINNLLVNGTGAILRSGTNGYWLGSIGVCERGLAQADGCSARIQAAGAGASTVQLTAASLAAGYVSRFANGDWIMVGGLNTQALWNTPASSGSPPNLTYYEWRQITNVNAGTGVITLDRPLTNAYLDTWPEYNAGDAGRPDQGGPATIWTVGQTTSTWNATFEYVGLTLYIGGQIYTPGRNVIYRNVTFPSGSGLGAIPTQNENWSAYGSTWNAAVEVDKLIGTFILDSSSLTLVSFQSNSTDLFIARNNTTFSTGLFGGGKRSELTDVTIADFRPGSYAYGNTPGPVICTRCNVTTWQNGGVFQDDNPSPYSMSGGVISFPNTAAAGAGPAQRWASTIGKTVFFATNGTSGQYSTLGQFTVSGVTQDATNTYVQTNTAGGFPDFSTNYGGTRIQFRANGAQQFTCDACTGDASFTAMNVQNGATPLAPMMTYAKRSYNPSAAGQAGTIPGIGKLVSLTIDVTVAGAASGALTLAPAQFNANMVRQSNWSAYNWMYSINLKQTGTRVITPSGITCNSAPGGCSGDGGTLTVPEAVWLYAGVGAWVNGTPTSNPQFTITLQTDQSP